MNVGRWEKIKHRESRVYRRANLHSSCIHHSSRPRYIRTNVILCTIVEGEKRGGRKAFKSNITSHDDGKLFSRIIRSSNRKRMSYDDFREVALFFLELGSTINRESLENLFANLSLFPRNFTSSRTSAHAFHFIDHQFRNFIFALTPTYEERRYTMQLDLGSLPIDRRMDREEIFPIMRVQPRCIEDAFTTLLIAPPDES